MSATTEAMRRLLVRTERALSAARRRQLRAKGTREGQVPGSNRVRLMRAADEVEQGARQVEDTRACLEEWD